MVDLHKIKPRLQSPILAQVLTQYPVVVVHGARQTGKTTLVQEHPIDQGRTFLSLDDFDVRDVAQSDPAALFIGRFAEFSPLQPRSSGVDIRDAVLLEVCIPRHQDQIL